jgi:hypothetical protein
MSQQLINLSPDLKRLQDEGYEIEIRWNHLLIHSVPYVTSTGEIAKGTLVSDLILAGGITAKPVGGLAHVAHFIGDYPCTREGVRISQIQHMSNRSTLAGDIVIDHSFSNKPAAGYTDYHEKMTRYVEIISAHAASIDPSVTACTFKIIEAQEEKSPFVYFDTASSRAGIGAISEKLALPKVAIVGLGGTGSYVLDLLAKTPVQEIHLFDGDIFLQHNAFRSPGAAPLETLKLQPRKVDHFKSIYSQMHKGIIAHEGFISEKNVQNLRGVDFVFLCIDNGIVKRAIIDELLSSKTQFIDVGMGIELIEESGELVGICRVTTSSISKQNHISSRIPLADAQVDHVYGSNIQVADLNALNAALAVIKWKKICGFYQDIEREHNSTYSINVNQLTSDELDAT